PADDQRSRSRVGECVNGDAVQRCLVVCLDYKVRRVEGNNTADQAVFGEVGNGRGVVLFVPKESRGGKRQGTGYGRGQKRGQSAAKKERALHGIPPYLMNVPLLLDDSREIMLWGPEEKQENFFRTRDRIQETRLPRSGAGASSEIRSEEHTSELQSRFDLVCRLLLEKTTTILMKNTVDLNNDDVSGL